MYIAGIQTFLFFSRNRSSNNSFFCFFPDCRNCSFSIPYLVPLHSYIRVHTHQMQNQPLNQQLTLYILKLILHHFTAVLNYFIFYYYYIYLILLKIFLIINISIFELIILLDCKSLFTQEQKQGLF